MTNNPIFKDKHGREIYEGHVLRSFDGSDARICTVYCKKGRLRVKYPKHNFDESLEVFMFFNTLYDFDNEKPFNTNVEIVENE